MMQLRRPAAQPRPAASPCQWAARGAARGAHNRCCALRSLSNLAGGEQHLTFAATRPRHRLATVGSSRRPNEDIQQAPGSSGGGGSTSSSNETRPVRRAVLTGLLGSAASAAAAPSQPAVGAVDSSPPAAVVPPAASSCYSGAAAAAAVRDPTINAGCATPAAVRQQLQLTGLVPPRQVDLQVEVDRGWAALETCSTPLEKHRLLITLKETNQAAFFALLRSDVTRLLPLVYTPTIGDACLAWGRLLPRPSGLYVTLRDRGRVRELLQQWSSREVRIAVITDGERILGLGDLGAHGMGIPTGKCSVYGAAGVTPPEWLLPVTVDVGTDNQALLADPLYVGQPSQRVRGQPYTALMLELVQALQQEFGRPVLVHWEDLAAKNSFRLLQAVSSANLAPTFNDDIQATGAVALAAILGAVRLPGVVPLAQQRCLFFGAGQASIGTAQLLVKALTQQQGVPAEAARSSVWMIDSKGLLLTSRQDLTPEKQQFAQDAAKVPPHLSSSLPHSSKTTPQQQLVDIIAAVQPTALIGAAAVPGAFTQQVVQALVSSVGPRTRPLLLALSNPTSKAEVSFEDAWHWSGGRVVFASGSPFPPLLLGRPLVAAAQMLIPAQANNCLIFPGLGRGVIDSGATAVTDEMLLAAAHAVAGAVMQEELASECVLPQVARLQEVTAAVAAAVAAAAKL